MIGRYVKGRVSVFIDAANVFYSQKTLQWRISYQNLLEYLRAECDLARCFVYCGRLVDNSRQEKFLDMLALNGFVVRTKQVRTVGPVTSGKQKCNFDVELTIDALDTIQEYDTFLLLSGDGDFAPLLDRIRSVGKSVLVISTRGHISIELLKRAKYIDFRKLRSCIGQ